MIAALLPDTLSQSDRRYYFGRVRGAWFGGVLVVKDKKTRAVYAVDEDEPFSVAGRPAVRRFLVKKVKADDVYCVTVATHADYQHCTCIGHNVHKNCKHSDALASLVREHALPDLSKPEEP